MLATVVPGLITTCTLGAGWPMAFEAAAVTALEFTRKASVWMPRPAKAALSVNCNEPVARYTGVLMLSTAAMPTTAMMTAAMITQRRRHSTLSGSRRLVDALLPAAIRASYSRYRVIRMSSSPKEDRDVRCPARGAVAESSSGIDRSSAAP